MPNISKFKLISLACVAMCSPEVALLARFALQTPAWPVDAAAHAAALLHEVLLHRAQETY